VYISVSSRLCDRQFFTLNCFSVSMSRVIVPDVRMNKSGVNAAVPLCTRNKYLKKVKYSSNKSHQMSANNNQNHRKRVIMGGVGPRSALIDKIIKLSRRLITHHIVEMSTNWRKSSKHS
jgi:hypothetical protein